VHASAHRSVVHGYWPPAGPMLLTEASGARILKTLGKQVVSRIAHDPNVFTQLFYKKATPRRFPGGAIIS
jgi:hypothetical protein